MAKWTRALDEDDFFGIDDVDDNNNNIGGCTSSTVFERSDGCDRMAAHETAAQEDHYRALGYHETYDSSWESTLQSGFSSGYRDTFAAAVRIGNLVGQTAMAQQIAQILVVNEGDGNNNNNSAVAPTASGTSSTAQGKDTRVALLTATNRIRAVLVDISAEDAPVAVPNTIAETDNNCGPSSQLPLSRSQTEQVQDLMKLVEEIELLLGVEDGTDS